MTKSASTEKKRRFVLFFLLGAVALAVALFAIFMAFSPDTPPASSQVLATKQDSVQGGAGGVGSDEYNRTLKEHDRQQANAALQAGESHVPTPVGHKVPVVVKKEEEKPKPPPVEPVRTAPVRPQPPQAPKRNNELLKRMMDDLKNLDAQLASASMNTGQIVYTYDASLDANNTGEKSGEDTPAASTSRASNDVPLAVKPGDMLYAIVDTGVNSDVPSAVLATVVAGAYKNARLLGSFQRFEERLVLTFSRVILANGTSIQLEAYAVDPQTSEASVASSVDTHFFSRWGGLIAASFLEGLSTAKRFSGAQSTVYGNVGTGQSSDQMVWNSYSPADQAWIAAGKVGERAGEIFEKSFDRPPTVYLESGASIGVLVLNVKGM